MQDYDEKAAYCCCGDRTQSGLTGIIPQWRPVTNSTASLQYNGLLMPYIKNRQIFTCPSYPALDYNSYCMNRAVGQGSRIWSIAELKYPAQLAILSDGAGSKGFCGANRTTKRTPSDGNCSGIWGGAETTYRDLWRRHNEGVNVAFADGHVKWIKAVPAMDSTACALMFNPAPSF